VLIDGLGDVSIPSLGHLTPLQALHLGHLNTVARICDPVNSGYVVVCLDV